MTRHRRGCAVVVLGFAAALLAACGGDEGGGATDSLGLPETGAFVDRFPPSTVDVTPVTAPVDLGGTCVTGYRALDGLVDADGQHVVLVLSIVADPERPDALYDVLADPACAQEVAGAETAVRRGLGLVDGDPDPALASVAIDLAFETASGRMLSLPVPG